MNASTTMWNTLERASFAGKLGRSEAPMAVFEACATVTLAMTRDRFDIPRAVCFGTVALRVPVYSMIVL